MAEGVSHCHDLHIVLLGGLQSGKSSVANSFLNIKFKSDQITTQCVKMEGNIHGRKIILVDTPGWWRSDQLCETPERLKVELIKSTTFCPPGPHVFLLVIEVDIAFTDKHRNAAESHMQLIGDNIWNHTIVVFTKLKYLTDKTIQQYVEREGENLNKLTQKCENRYVGFDSDLDTDGSQLKELFSQIEKLVAENNGRYFDVDATKLTDLEIKLKNVEKKATARELRVSEKRRKLKENKSADAQCTCCSTPLNVVLLGWVLSGKTLAGSVILGAEISFDKTVKCVKTCGEVNGRQVTVVDTPSWWKFLPHQLNADSVKTEILKAMASSPNAVLLVIPADTSFLDEQMQVILENMRPLGENVWRQTIVLFTWGGTLGNKSIEYHIESEGNALVRLIEMCGNRYHVFESMKDDRTQVNQLLEKIDEMIDENALLNSDEHLAKKQFQETETVSEWLRVEDVKKLFNEEWERSGIMVKEMLKTMSPSEAVRRGGSISSPPSLSGEVKNTALFVNKHQIKAALDREWNRREAVDSIRIQYQLNRLDACEMSSCVSEEDLKMSVAKVHSWYERCHLSDYGSVSSYEEHDQTEQDND